MANLLGLYVTNDQDRRLFNSIRDYINISYGDTYNGIFNVSNLNELESVLEFHLKLENKKLNEFDYQLANYEQSVSDRSKIKRKMESSRTIVADFTKILNKLNGSLF